MTQTTENPKLVIVVTHGTTAKINLESIAKGFHNTVGMYKVTSEGAIHSVDILFSPDGGKGGGQAVYPNKSIDVQLEAGEQLGFLHDEADLFACRRS